MLRYLIVLFISVIVIGNSSCKKTEPCKAVITVQDKLGRPVPGAKVVLRQDSVVNAQTGVRSDVFQEQTSTGTGEAFFEFKWEAVLNVEVTKDTSASKDFIRLEQSKEVRKTITL